MDPGEGDPGLADRLFEGSRVLAPLVSASVQARVALGLHAGAGVRRMLDEPEETAPLGSWPSPGAAGRV